MPQINVAVNGVLGKMGQEVLKTVCREPGLKPVGAVDMMAATNTLPLPDGSGLIPLSRSLADVLDQTEVVVDFTNFEGGTSVIQTAPARGVNVVIGSTGIPDQVIEEAENLAQTNSVGIVIAPNFAIGALMMMHLAKITAPYFDYADLTEMHHEAKIDAPSGTALAIAKALVAGKGGPFKAPKAEKELVAGSRGGTSEGVTIHSARMPGRMAHHELVLGALGQTLTIRHDSINRESFMPGVVMAIEHVADTPGLTFGLEKIMGL
ncbi:4-hydroxy-tetrahydrodipicolinate reductase [Dehalococcoidia bacterium]|jgi:4-hydroxy-tetrahydrodipicolinate reductase|nr:4-hydroxy-tetrahydrodipicolinate reductase [Dehalococcoidia bacterium]